MIEISKQLDGKIRAKLFQGNSVSLPLQLYPVAPLSYFEVCIFVNQLFDLPFLFLVSQYCSPSYPQASTRVEFPGADYAKQDDLALWVSDGNDVLLFEGGCESRDCCWTRQDRRPCAEGDGHSEAFPASSWDCHEKEEAAVVGYSMRTERSAIWSNFGWTSMPWTCYWSNSWDSEYLSSEYLLQRTLSVKSSFSNQLLIYVWLGKLQILRVFVGGIDPFITPWRPFRFY